LGHIGRTHPIHYTAVHRPAIGGQDIAAFFKYIMQLAKRAFALGGNVLHRNRAPPRHRRQIQRSPNGALFQR
jgi:hypothetical protein